MDSRAIVFYSGAFIYDFVRIAHESYERANASKSQLGASPSIIINTRLGTGIVYRSFIDSIRSRSGARAEWVHSVLYRFLHAC